MQYITAIFKTRIQRMLTRIQGNLRPLKKLWKPPSRKSYQKSQKFAKKYWWWSFVIVKPCFFLVFFVCFAFVVHSNFVYDSEANYLMKLYFTLHKKSNFPLRISSVNVTADLVT